MKHIQHLALVLGTLACSLAQAGSSNVGVSVSVNQPGFYGRVDIGNQPAPVVIYPQPVIIQQSPVAVVQRPIYMHVPPGHYKRWDRYCARYRACGQPVYFVQNAPVMVQPGRGPHGDRDDDRREDRRDDRRDDHGHGRGHGHGHGH